MLLINGKVTIVLRIVKHELNYFCFLQIFLERMQRKAVLEGLYIYIEHEGKLRIVGGKEGS